MRKFLMLFCLALPLGADDARLWVGTLGPTQGFSLVLAKDHSATLVFRDRDQSLRAFGSYTWEKNDLKVKVRKAEPFVLEIRRKGVDTPPPTMEVKSGTELHWKTTLVQDRLLLKGPPGWELPLYAEH
ncbi:MAG: hypothetical protein J0I12_17245 [Candidatus Eremiobacteraeota bacterium]|nr:hypothetical protein [Candidatus Eremiobacteraeota bacterium]